MSSNLRSRVATLRLSLLAAAGLVPIACGGVMRSDGDDEGPGTGGSRSGKPGGRAGVGTDPGSGTGPGPVVGVGGSGPIVGTGGGGPIVVGGSGPQLPSCTAPKLNPVTGLVTCQEGYSHRPTAIVCQAPPEAVGGQPASAGAGGEGPPVRPRADGTVICSGQPAVCDAFDLGYCGGGDEDFEGAGGYGNATCRSGCRTDQDCGTGSICICAPGYPAAGFCQRAQCATDSDCGPWYRCASYGAGCGYTGFACQTAKDECTGDNDCEDGVPCGWGELGPFRQCDYAVCGRPFLVERTARLAPIVESGAWLAQRDWTPATSHLTRPERAALAEHWMKMGQMEHASIAAFARFSLQLLSLGAPPALVEACTQALADETAHTKLCFQLASAYAGHAVGPGRLDVDRSLNATSLEEIVDLVLAEGCFGETGAALEALEAADTASDPVIRAAYEQIARDEQRHAELAFQFVRWALERDYDAVQARIVAALAEYQAPSPALRSVVAPCLEALLGSRAA
ncbi:MAG TPA: ferritin-like domain-containing protein [Polyangiaceae bacterium]|nr:ferritin-like domain-containing protein [Polyangiaceae bacterium]